MIDEAPAAARPSLDLLADQLRATRDRIEAVTARIEVAQKEDPLARRLATLVAGSGLARMKCSGGAFQSEQGPEGPGIGALSSSALAATTPEVDNFRTGRDYAAWPGLTPRAHSTGGKERLGRISKGEAPNAIRPREGPNNRYLRRLPYLGAMARIGARRAGKPGDDWLWRMLAGKPVKVVAIALANRMARVVWAFAIGLEHMATQ